MIILAMDTSGPSLGVALTKGEKLLFDGTAQNGLNHSKTLMPFVDQALGLAGIGPGDVDLFACVHGPGSFTGVRIGVATTKGLSHGTGKPCMGINALEALAEGVAHFPGVVCALQDARAGQVYGGAFLGGKRLFPDAADALESWLGRLMPMGRCCFVGDGALRHREAIHEKMGEQAFFPDGAYHVIRAAYVAAIARRNREEALTYRELMPYYLRAPQAERERVAKEARREDPLGEASHG